MSSGHFITLEGGEGTGKSTQAARIKQFLESHHLKVILTREPGGCDNAEKIRHLLVKGETHKWDAISEYLLFSAARRQHLLEVVWPSLQQGHWVICDRFYDSSRAYQGAGHGVKDAFLQTVYQQIAGDFMPSLTFILDLEVQGGLARTVERHNGQKHGQEPGKDHIENRFEKMGSSFHERVRQAFLAIARAEPQRCSVINASQSVETVFQDIQKHLMPLLAKVQR